MKALILAGGRGKRMRPITDYVPKPLVPICNVPIMEWQIRYLVESGISDIVICTGYKTGMIEDRLNAKDYDARVTVSAEETPLGTGGAIRQACAHVKNDDTFVVLNGDVITDIDMGRLIRVRNSIATIPLRTNYGTLDISDAVDTGIGGGDGDYDDDADPSMRGAAAAHVVTGFREKEPVQDMWMNAGIYHLGREVIDDLPAAGDIETTLFPEYARRRMLRAVRFGHVPRSASVGGANRNYGGGKAPSHEVMWQSVDSFKDLETCTRLLAGRRAGAGVPGGASARGADR